MIIDIDITDKRPTVEATPVIVCGNSDYTIRFTFDEEWGALVAKTARFVYRRAGKTEHQDVPFVGDTVAVPVLSDVNEVYIGLYAGNLCTTTPARIPCDRSILCGSTVHEEPEEDVYNQLMGFLNDVVAISDERILKGVSDYVKENPIVDYENLDNKPTINGRELSGEMTNETLGLSSPTPEQVAGATQAWLDEHPEATTTVQDGSISTEKLADESVSFAKLSADAKSGLSGLINDYIYNGYIYTESDNGTTPAVEDFEIGGINDGQGGTDVANIARIRTIGYLDKTIKAVSTEPGYYFSLHLYNPDGTYAGSYDGTNVGTFAWLESVDLTPLADYSIRLVVKNSASSAILPDVVLFVLHYEYEATGDEDGETVVVRPLNDRLTDVENGVKNVTDLVNNFNMGDLAGKVATLEGEIWDEVYVDGVYGIPGDYEQGVINTNNGRFEDNTIRIRTINYLDKNIIGISAVNGYEFGVALFNLDETFAAAYDGNTVGTFAWLTEVNLNAVANRYLVKIFVKNSSNSSIKVDEAVNIQYVRADGSNTSVVRRSLRESVELLEVELGTLERELENKTASLQAAQFSKRLWDRSKKKNVYEAWPFGNAWYDKTTGKHCLIVDAKGSHTSTDGDVYFTSKYDFGSFSEPVLVAQHTATYGCRTHGSGINAKGEYLALVLHYDSSGGGPLYVYKSADKGATWNSYELMIDGANPTSGETGSCFLTKSGRLLSFNRLTPSPSAGCKIIYSDDHGATWHGVSINNGTAPNPLEGSFIELSNGDIHCVVRGALGGTAGTYVTKSTDGGTSWTTLEQMDDIDALLNSVAFVHHKKAKKVEMLYASRKLQPNGLGSLYRRICTEAEFESGYYGEEVKIANGGANASDFGYVAASVSDKNVVNMYYYITDSEGGGVCIMNAELDWIY